MLKGDGSQLLHVADDDTVPLRMDWMEKMVVVVVAGREG